MFADDLTLYTEVHTSADCGLLQDDLASVLLWSQRWQLSLNSAKCEAINVSNKCSPVSFSYFVNGHSIQWNSQVRYLGVFFDSQCHHVVAKATRKLKLLRRSLFGCPSTVKSLAFISIVRPHLEYASIVWNPYTSADVNLLEAVQQHTYKDYNKIHRN